MSRLMSPRVRESTKFFVDNYDELRTMTRRRRPPMKTALLILLAIAICFSIYAAADSRNGVWTAELNTEGTALQMTLFRGNNETHLGMNHRGMNNVMGFEL